MLNWRGGKEKLEQFQQWIVKVSDLQQKEKQLNLKEEELMRKENNFKRKWTEDTEVEKQMQRETKKLQDRVLALENIVYQHKQDTLNKDLSIKESCCYPMLKLL